MRIDLLLVEKGLAPSRNRAQELIESGCVHVQTSAGKKTITKASYKVSPEEAAHLEVDAATDVNQYVSRGGLKMKGALEQTKLQVEGMTALDIGLSTGGFTDCLLQSGVRSVIGVDVGRGQLAEKLKTDPRLRSIEGINARQLSSVSLVEMNVGSKFDLIVIDVSFISLALVLPEAIQYLMTDGHLLALVKPQFEVGREGLGKNGIVKDPSLYREVEAKIREICDSLKMNVEDYFESSIEGSDGNREFFVHARFK